MLGGMDLAIFGLIRSGTTLLTDKLTVRGKSVIISEPDLHVPWSGGTAKQVVTQLREFGFDLDPGLAERSRWPSFRAFFDQHVLPLVSGLEMWGVKQVDFAQWRWFMDTYQPRKLILISRDVRDVALSAHDLLARGKFASPITRRRRAEDWILGRLLASTQDMLAMTKLPHLAVRYEDLCRDPSKLDEVAAYVGLEKLSDERLVLASGQAPSRKYEQEKHGSGISGASIARWAHEPEGPALALARYVWNRCPEFSEHFGYDAPSRAVVFDLAPAHVKRLDQLMDPTDARHAASEHIAAGSRVLDVGSGTGYLEAVLPGGCRHVPCDVSRRQDGTVLWPFQGEPLPPLEHPVDMVAAMHVMDYLVDVPSFLCELRRLSVPVVLGYHPVDKVPREDRERLGWKSHLTTAELEKHVAEADFQIQRRLVLRAGGVLLRCLPGRREAPVRREVLVIVPPADSPAEERQGRELLAGHLPSSAFLRFVRPEGAASMKKVPDLVVVGTGSTISRGLLRPEVLEAVRRAPRAIGIFGTAFRQRLDRKELDDLLGSLDTWYARTEEDLLTFGSRAKRVVHLGDWHLASHVWTSWSQDETLDMLKADPALKKGKPLPDVIIQSYRRVISRDLRPVVLALLSAEEVAWSAKRKAAAMGESSKFRSLFLDVFGRAYPPDKLFSVDRRAVNLYREKVRENMAMLRRELAEHLAAGAAVTKVTGGTGG